MRTPPIPKVRFIQRALVVSASLAAFAAVLTVAEPAAAAAGGKACFEQGDPKWAPMRSMADQFVIDGALTRDTAEAYKCDPRLASQNLSIRLRVEAPSGPQPLISGCGSTANIIVELGWPVALVAKQNLSWCYNGTTVSSWSGVCTGWTTGWGTANFWDWDGCTTNDFIPYTLNGHYPGGVHHYTGHHFVNKLPWVYNITQNVSTWGHFDATWD